MLPYHEDGKRLEKLLGKLLEDDDSIPEDVDIFVKPTDPIPFGNCCMYNYGNY